MTGQSNLFCDDNDNDSGSTVVDCSTNYNNVNESEDSEYLGNTHEKQTFTHDPIAKQLELFEFESDDEDEMSVSDSESYQSLDACINAGYEKTHEMFSLNRFARGQNQQKRRKTADMKPVVFARFETKHGSRKKPMTLKALLDSGASGTLVSSKFTKELKEKKDDASKWTTMAGKFTTSTTVRSYFSMPELHDNKVIEWDFHVIKDMGAYDMIIGRDLMRALGINLNFKEDEIEWETSTIPFKDTDCLEEQFYIRDPYEQEYFRAEKILDNDYKNADIKTVVESQEHLSKEEQKKLLEVLMKYEDLFDGTLGAWTHPDYKIELKEGVKPYHARSFPVPKVHYETLKKEVERLCDVGVLKRVNRSEWAAPTFIIPKKDGKVRFVSDFRELNKRIKRHPYPVPNIQDMMLNLEGFQYATALDLNMGYYHVRLDPESRKLCTIILPFGKFEYQRLPQGICNGPDIFQEKMAELFDGIEFVRAYIDDLLILTKGDHDDHLEKLEVVLQKLTTAGLKVNAPKSFFSRGELEYLGYLITREGIKPIPKKVQAIQKIAAPTNKKELRSFIGVVNYYRDMWIRRSHLLAPLAELTSKSAKWKWEEIHEKSFRDIKNVIAREVMLAYPDFTLPFDIHTDASHTQLGAVISQKGKPIAFYSRKLNPAQTRYTTTERELLSIVETLKEFKNILLGHKLVVYTDHKNLTCKNFNTERVMRWRLVLEEFGPELKYIKGENNIVADALSRLAMLSNEDFKEQYAVECFAADDKEFPKEFPLSYMKIEHCQENDASLQKLVKDKPDGEYKCEVRSHAGKPYKLWTKDGKIVIPEELQKPVVDWYHEILCHPGETRMELTIGQHYYWKNMRKTIQSACRSCGICRATKPKSQKYGHLPPKDAEVSPWKTVCIDLIGDYKFGKGKKQVNLSCLTMIDPATGWFEIVTIDNKTSNHIANKFEQTWLNRYPWPEQVQLDRGTEFMGAVSDMLFNDYGFKRKPITTRNPQANAMVERAHKTIHNMIRSQTVKDCDSLTDGSWDGVLGAVAFAMRSTVHTTTKATAAQLVFGRDAMLNVKFEADWQLIKERKDKLIRKNNERENKKRIAHDYRVGDRVLILQDPNRKHGEDRYQEASIVRVNDNGTVLLKQSTFTASGRRRRDGAIYQTWNIRNIHPCRD